MLVEVTEECEYIIDWKTPYACPVEVATPRQVMHFIMHVVDVASFTVTFLCFLGLYDILYLYLAFYHFIN